MIEAMSVVTQVTAMKSLLDTRFFPTSHRGLVTAVGLAVLLSLAGTTLAAEPAAGKPLPAWEQLTPAQRELLIAPTRERWNTLEPARRENMLERARHWQRMSPEQRERAHHGLKRWQDMNPEKREQTRALYSHMRSLDDVQRKAMLTRWRAMTPEQRKAWVEQHPAPQGDAD